MTVTLKDGQGNDLMLCVTVDPKSGKAVYSIARHGGSARYFAARMNEGELWWMTAERAEQLTQQIGGRRLLLRCKPWDGLVEIAVRVLGRG